MSGLINASDLGLFEKLDARLMETSTKMEELIGKFERFRDLLDGDLKQKLVFIRNQVRDVSIDAAKSSRVLQDLEDSFKKLNQQAGNYHANIQNGARDAAKYEKEIRSLRDELNKLKAAKDAGTVSTAKFNSGISSLMARFSLAYVGANLLIRGITGLQTQLREAFASSLEFEVQMVATGAVMRATSEEMIALTANANKLGASTEFTSSQIAVLQKELGKLGFSAAEAINATKAITDLSTATQEDLVKAGTVAASTLRIFNLVATETDRVVNVMTGSFVRSALDLEKYRESMKLLGPIAKSAGIDLETTVAVLSRLADAGLSGSLAGTSLRNILSRMADPTSKISKLLGGTVKNSDELIEAFQRMKATGIGLTETIQLMDVRARPAFLTFLQQVDKIKDLRDEYRGLEGEGARLATMMRDTLANDIEILNSAFDALRREGLNSFNEGIRLSVQNLTLFTEALRLVVAGRLDMETYLEGLSVGFLKLSGIMSNTTDVTEAWANFQRKVRDGQTEEAFDQLKAGLGGIQQNFELATDEASKLVKVTADAKREYARLKDLSAKGELQDGAKKLAQQLNLVNALSEQVVETFGEEFVLMREDGLMDPQIASLEMFIKKQEESFLLGVESTRKQKIEKQAYLKALDREAEKQAEILNAERAARDLIEEKAGKAGSTVERLKLQDEYFAKQKLIQQLELKDNETASKRNQIASELGLINAKLLEFTKGEAKIREKIAASQEDYTEDAIEATADYLAIKEQELKFEVERLQKTVTSEKMAYEEKLVFANKLKEKREELAKAELNNELAQIERSAKNESDRLTRKILAQNKYKNDVQKAEQELTIFINNEMEKRLEAETKALDRRIELNSRMVRRQIQILSETNAAMQGNSAIQAEGDVEDAERALDRLSDFQLGKTKKLLDRLAALKKAANDRQLQEAIANNAAQLANEEKTIMRSQEFLAQGPEAQQEILDQLRAKYDTYLTGIELRFKQSGEVIADELENSMLTLLQKIARIVEEVGAVVGNIVNAGYDNRRQKLEDELNYLTEWEQERTELLGDNTEAREAIEREAERRRRQLNRERAILDKQQAMFNIGLSTAVGVAKALGSSLPPKNFIEAAIVAVQGGIQLAIAASKKIPAFEKGTRSSPEGPALVGEAGAELAVDRQGKAFMTPSGPTVMDLKAGTRIFTANETQDILKSLRNGDINNSITQEFLSRMETQRIDVERVLDGFRKELRSMPKDEIYIDENGFNKYQHKELRRVRVLNKRYGFKY